MKEIQITQGNKAVINDDDFDKVSRYKWYSVTPVKCTWQRYAAAKNYPDGGFKTILMHRLIMNAPKGVVVDHKDGNGLNNQRSNLRLCTDTQNKHNCRLSSTNKSGYRGVSFHDKTKKFRAYISKNNKTIHLGLYETSEDAARARDKICEELRGEFAVLNFR